MKKVLYVILWILTVLNLAFCAFLLVFAISTLGETNAAGVVVGGIFLIHYDFISMGTTLLTTGLSFITIKNKKLRIVLYVNLAAVALVITTSIILFGFVFPNSSAE